MNKRNSNTDPGHSQDEQDQLDQTRDLANDLGVKPKDFGPFRQSVEQIVNDHQVVLSASDSAVLPPPGKEVVGKFQLHKNGFGFIVPDSPIEHGDLFVPAGRTGGGFTGDRVRARVIRESRGAKKSGGFGKKRSPYIGHIVEILQRSDKCYVGNLLKRGQQWIVKVDGKLLHTPVIIRDPHAKNAKLNDKVVVELIEFPMDNSPPQGVITEVLGETGQPDVETLAVVRSFELPGAFPEHVVEEARAITKAFNETIPPDREDLTASLICTIDPPDAKDFDDAINVTRLSPDVEADNALYELGVHIADVSSFVAVNSTLDQEAFARGNSTYLPRTVIPMLPELLSNGICSLQEGVNRYSKSAFIRYDAQGNVVGQRFSNTVIRSTKRFTYLEAQALIDGDLREARKHAKTPTKYPRQLVNALKLMDELSRLIRKRRFKEGMIVLDLPDAELVYDDLGFVIDAVPQDDAYTHTLIEMCMVEANEAVARLFNTLQIPMIRRTHPDPDTNNVDDLRRFARVAGYNIPERPNRHDLQTLLNAVRGKTVQHAVHLAVLKTLSKAEYSPALIGHFALASEHYTHFTSPIRRYPDLIVHRAIDAYLEHTNGTQPGRSQKGKKKQLNKLSDDPRCPDIKTLSDWGRHCSTTERNSESAERDLRTFLVLQLLSNHLGDDFQGTVTGVVNSGIFVQIDRYLVDGFIHTTELPTSSSGSDRWKLNRATGALVAQRSGKTITIGDRFTVRIANINAPGRSMELVIVEDQLSKQTKRRQPQGARKASKKTMKLKQIKKKDRKRK